MGDLNAEPERLIRSGSNFLKKKKEKKEKPPALKLKRAHVRTV